MNPKVIVLDWSIYMFSATYASKINNMPPTYTALSMILGNLKKIGISHKDIIIVACDGRDCWRKRYEPTYKSQRKEQRDKSGINFDKVFRDFDVLLDSINKATSWNVIKLYSLEADDIASVCCKYENFKNKEIILCSFDGDWQLLWDYPNVKIFSPKTKRWKIKPIKFNSTKEILKKVHKEAVDGLTNPILCEKQYNDRLLCVNLLNVPIFVEVPIIAELDNLEEKENHLENLPYPTLRERFMGIYNEGTEPYKKSVKYYERKEKAKLKKKALKKGERKRNV